MSSGHTSHPTGLHKISLVGQFPCSSPTIVMSLNAQFACVFVSAEAQLPPHGLKQGPCMILFHAVRSSLPSSSSSSSSAFLLFAVMLLPPSNPSVSFVYDRWARRTVSHRVPGVILPVVLSVVFSLLLLVLLLVSVLSLRCRPSSSSFRSVLSSSFRVTILFLISIVILLLLAL
jgi:hypothetical protein